MGSSDVVDDVNALLKLGVGDPYRLEHIKQAYILNSTIWKSDDRYLAQLREKYLVKHRIDQPDIQPEIDGKVESDSENKDMIHCWKCGKKSTLGANFCMVCGSSIFEVGTEPQIPDVKMPSVSSKNQTKSIGLKIPILIGIPVLVLIILGGAYSQGVFDNSLVEVSDEPIGKKIESKVSVEKVVSTESNSKCGAGTVFDSETNSCILESEAESKDKVVSSSEANSKCGAGTVFDSETNSCILDK
jgi:hypothetical protein